ncbi:MAG TPA: hypothetical protein DEA32_02760 [Firmicutes bacterium]|nr:hypothetical protein [Bacillota bacterium]
MSTVVEKKKLSFGIVLDSTTIVDSEYASLVDIARAPLHITLGNETRDENDWTIKEIVDGYDTKVCKTSCPSTGEFVKAFKEIFAKGYDDIVCIPMSKGISGTYQAAKVAASTFEGKEGHIHIVSVPLANFGITTLLNASLKYLKEGLSAAQYAAVLERMGNSSSQIWTLGSLEYLYKGGRLSKLSFAIGSLFRIKPIIGVSPKDGKLTVEKKVRTFPEVDKFMCERLNQFFEKFNRVYVRFINLGDENQVATLKTTILTEHPNLENSEISEVGPLFTVHLGRNGYGICIIGDEPKANSNSSTKNWTDIFHLNHHN